VTARRLLAWSDREERRRRAARTGLGRLPPIAWSAVAGAALAAEMARRIDAGDPGSASQLWIAVGIVGFASVVFGAPFRMFWRRDSAFLARLPLDGGALYRLALIRSARAAIHIAIPVVMGAAAFGPLSHWDVAIRHLALAGAAAAGAAMLGPAVALFAGAIVASDRALQLVQSIGGGEVGAPKTAWLGIFPGIAAAAVAAALMAGARWVAGDSMTAIGAPGVLFGALVGGPAAILGASLPTARTMMTDAVREVAALDYERLAHIEITRPSLLERAWERAAVPAAARAVFEKDAKLSRRRYPGPYFLSFAGVAALWIVAAARPDNLTAWTAAIVGFLAVYTVIMARRLAIEPVEHPRFLRTLPIASASVAAAKRQAVILRALFTIGAGAAPVIARAPDPAPLAIAVAIAIALALAAGLRLCSTRA
jgi:hypothetical protein